MLVTAIVMQLATTVKVLGFIYVIWQVTLYCYLSNSTALSPGAIAGIIVGTIIGLVLIAGFFFIVFFLRKLMSGMKIIYVSEDMKRHV